MIPKLIIGHPVKEVSEKKNELIQKVAEINGEIYDLRQKVNELNKLIVGLDI